MLPIIAGAFVTPSLLSMPPALASTGNQAYQTVKGRRRDRSTRRVNGRSRELGEMTVAGHDSWPIFELSFVPLKYYARLIRAVRRSFSRRAFIHRRSFSSRSNLSPSLFFPLSTRSSRVENMEEEKTRISLFLSLFQIQPVITWSTRNGRIIALGPLFARGFCSLNLYSYRFSYALFRSLVRLLSRVSPRTCHVRHFFLWRVS